MAAGTGSSHTAPRSSSRAAQAALRSAAIARAPLAAPQARPRDCGSRSGVGAIARHGGRGAVEATRGERSGGARGGGKRRPPRRPARTGHDRQVRQRGRARRDQVQRHRRAVEAAADGRHGVGHRVEGGQNGEPAAGAGGREHRARQHPERDQRDAHDRVVALGRVDPPGHREAEGGEAERRERDHERRAAASSSTPAGTRPAAPAAAGSPPGWSRSPRRPGSCPAPARRATRAPPAPPAGSRGGDPR